MDARAFHDSRRYADTPMGRVAFVERGDGPPALFVHGAFLNGYHWRDSLEALSDVRRCIALDLLTHGHSELASEDQDVSFPAQADMIAAFLDALGIDQIDLVGSDSGGAISQIFAARHLGRLRSLTLTNCDVHDNWPPRAFAPFLAMIRAGAIFRVGSEMLDYPELARSDFGLGVGYECPEKLSEETIRTYLEPVLSTEERAKRFERFFLAWNNEQTVSIEPDLRDLRVPTLIVWGLRDVFFSEKWADWLSETIPGTRRVVKLQTARLLFTEERPEIFARELRLHWGRES